MPSRNGPQLSVEKYLQQAMRHLDFANERMDKAIATDPEMEQYLIENFERIGAAYNRLEELIYKLRHGELQ